MRWRLHTKFQPLLVIHLHVIAIWTSQLRACSHVRPSVYPLVRGVPRVLLEWNPVQWYNICWVSVSNFNLLRGYLIADNCHLNSFSRMHATTSIHWSVRQLEGFLKLDWNETVEEHDMRCLCTKFEPSSMVGLFTIIFFGCQTIFRLPDKISAARQNFGCQTKNSAARQKIWLPSQTKIYDSCMGILWDNTLETS